MVESERKGLKKEIFRPKKGDALIWSADLVHGGSPIVEQNTRRSFVTHWCPVSADPMYLHYTGNSGRITASPQLSYAYSFHGRSAEAFNAAMGGEPAPKKSFWRRLLGA